MSEENIKKPGESVFNFLMVVLSSYLFWESYLISGFTQFSSPGAFPMAASAIMLVTVSIVFLKGLRKEQHIHGVLAFVENIMPLNVAIMIIVLLLFAMMLQTVGFILTALIFLFSTILFLHRKGPLRAALLSLLSLFIIYIIFRLIFKVVLPEGIVPEREIMAWIESLFSGNGGAE